MKNFLIVGTQRTGSSALAESIGVHPLVACGWEWTQRVPWHRKLKVAEQALAGDFSALRQIDKDHMAEVFNGRQTRLGFRRLFRASSKWLLDPGFAPALWGDRLEDHLSWLARRPDIHVIHIVRSDGLEWLKSKFLARETKMHWGRSYPDDVRVEIPVREAIARLRAKQWVDGSLAALADSNPYIQLRYEALVADQDAVAASALRFLDLDPAASPVRQRSLRRQSKGNAADYVQNYAELVVELEQRNLLAAQFTGYRHAM